MLLFDLKYIVRFLYKYLFILKAASDGWRVKYIGGDNFKFYNKHNGGKVDTVEEFICKYQNMTVVEM